MRRPWPRCPTRAEGLPRRGGLAWERPARRRQLAAERLQLLLHRDQTPFDRALAQRPVDAVHAVLDALQTLRYRAQTPREPLDVGGCGNVQCAQRQLLGLGGALARVERPADRACDQRVLDQVDERPADLVLGAGGQALAQPRSRLVSIGHRPKSTVRVCPRACSPSCRWSFPGSWARPTAAICCASRQDLTATSPSTWSCSRRSGPSAAACSASARARAEPIPSRPPYPSRAPPWSTRCRCRSRPRQPPG